MFVRLTSFALKGIEAVPVAVEIDVSPGIPTFDLVGLADTAVRESRERVRAAVRNGGWPFPAHRITVNLAPAYTKKGGAGFDLAIGLGLLAALGELASERLAGVAVAGELALDGSLRPVRGALAMAEAARACGCHSLILPAGSAGEGALVRGIHVYGAESLSQVVQHLQGVPLPQAEPCNRHTLGPSSLPDLADVKGQHVARRALEVAAAGGHNMVMVGPPGAGKSLLASCLPSILPPLGTQESMEVSRIHRVAGTLTGGGLLTQRPYRAPHHCASRSAVIGGGSPLRPGEVTLAHRGILFLDELPEFRREVLEGLRQPLEEGRVQLSRANGSETFPAQPMLVAAANPCACGYFGDPSRACTCPAHAVNQYRARLSGPVLDRFDLHLHLAPVPYDELIGPSRRGRAEPSRIVRERVVRARAVQEKRFAGTTICTNAQMTSAQVRRYCHLPTAGEALMRQAVEQMGFSMRGHDRVLKVARTIADLAGAHDLTVEHIAEAIAYRASSA